MGYYRHPAVANQLGAATNSNFTRKLDNTHKLIKPLLTTHSFLQSWTSCSTILFLFDKSQRNRDVLNIKCNFIAVHIATLSIISLFHLNGTIFESFLGS